MSDPGATPKADANGAYVTAALRWGGTMLAGYLVQRGIISGDVDPQTVIGAVVAVGTLVFSILQKHAAKRALTATAAAPAATPPPKVPL